LDAQSAGDAGPFEHDVEVSHALAALRRDFFAFDEKYEFFGQHGNEGSLMPRPGHDEFDGHLAVPQGFEDEFFFDTADFYGHEPAFPSLIIRLSLSCGV